MTPPLIILGWSTRNLPSAQVVDYAVHAIGAGLEPMSVEIPDPAGFDAALQCVVMGDVVVARGTGQSLRCTHARAEISRNSQRQYHIVLNRRSPWTLHHRGDVALRADDAVVMDSAYGYDFTYPSFDNAHLQLSESWIRQWVRDPAMLAGRSILKDSPWGAALCSYLKVLTPEFMARGPLPASLLIDHLGALLALVAHDVGAGAPALPRRDRVMRERILETLRQRCTEPGLTATDVAAVLGISLRTLHRHLASFRQTFGGALIGARIAVATRMLESRIFRHLTVAEIGRRAGFVDASHFTRAVRARTERTPLQIRRDAGIADS